MKINSPVLQGLESHIQKTKHNFSMPGHHHKSAYLNYLQNNFLKYDVTENLDTDNLYNSQTFLKTAMKKMAIDRGAKESFFLVNSSTGGILSCLLALCQPGDKVLIEEGSHQSIEHGIALSQAKKLVLASSLTNPAPQEAYIEMLENNKDCKLVFLTNPNYFGYSIKINQLVSYCENHEILLIVDEAHGAHFKYHPDLPETALEKGAHISIQSFHKTLPSLTQTAVINFSKKCPQEIIDKVLTHIQMLQTSSPSYLLMLSLDLARSYMEDHGSNKMEELKKAIDLFKSTLKNPSIQLIEGNEIKKDFTKILLKTDTPWSLEKYLFKNGIHVEMINENYLLIITTIMDTEKDILNLAQVINKYENTPIENKNSSYTKTYQAGMILEKNIYQYPPGNILYAQGDQLSLEDILLLENKKKQGILLINY